MWPKKQGNMDNNIKIIRYSEIDGAYIAISFTLSSDSVASFVSYLVEISSDVSIEYVPSERLLKRVIKSSKSDEESSNHWFYDFCSGEIYTSKWAVIDLGIDKALLKADYELMFGLMKLWGDTDK